MDRMLMLTDVILRVAMAVCCGTGGSSDREDDDESDSGWDDMPPRHGFIPTQEMEELMPVLPPGEGGL